MSAAVLALLSSLVWGTTDFLGGMRSRVRPALAVVGCSQVVGLVTMAVVVIGVHPLQVATWTSWTPYAVAAGVTGAVALAAFYTALSSGTMGIVAPIAAAGVVVPVLFGVLLGERPGVAAWAGMAVAVVGIVLASGPELRGGGASARPVLLAVVAGVGFGLVFSLLHKGAESSLSSTLFGMRLTSTLIYAGIAVRLRTIGGMDRSDLPWLLPIGVGDLGANGLFATASGLGLVSVTSVLSSLYPVVTILLARGFLHERLRTVQNVGVVCSLLGVVLLALG